MAYPQAEVNITPSLVSSLVQQQAPQFADLSIAYLDSGWDNESYRLGEDYIIRMPRRAKAIALLHNEIRFLPSLAKQLPIAIPAPIFVGKPQDNYPWDWTITPYFRGVSIDDNSLPDSEASRIASFLKNLHAIEVEDLPKNEHRDVPLAIKAEALDGYFKSLEAKGIIISKQIRGLWNSAVEEAPNALPQLIHGDLHPRNIIMHKEKIEAIIDWGDITKGDPATDLGSLWLLFPFSTAKKAAQETYGADDSMIKRSIGWAIYFAAVLLDTAPDNEHVFRKIGDVVLERIGHQL